ncbi:LON peptidase substrate-binding domain-containing protein [Salinibacterium sp. TMP30]|uniref:LON peptidase substrate-binding domain-containing protein n=1 Tax=Salinibacterium sp. TMP30 TaxID=3138237 RepID=UPI0031392916
MTAMPMFPLGSVLFPHMPLSLRIFEERYIVMLSKVLQDEPSEFGVVLIERGQEVGGGEKRFSVGTVATITQLEAAEGFVGVVAVGHGRIAITEWLDEDPHPQAAVSELPDLEWDDALLPLRERAEQLVRRTLARASEFSELNWSPDVELSEEPVVRAWQLAAIAPLGPLDQMSLLRSATMSELLEGVMEHTLGVELSLSSPWAADGMDDASGEPELP